MTLRRIRCPCEVSMTACPFCKEAIGQRESFVVHWPQCNENPYANKEDVER